MININHCANCYSKNIESFNASMDTFVTRRMQGENRSEVGPCRYIHCLDCDYAGSSYRFTREEEDRYYHEYMIPGGDYTKDRGTHHEANVYSSQEYKDMRKQMVASVLKKYLDLSSIQSVIDYGGNTGEMFPSELDHSQRYVVDVEVRDLANGVRAIKDPSESGPVDLIICAHTLEHVSDPFSFIVDIKRYMKSGSWIYIEVPDEVTGIFKNGHNFHEHINHYMKRSLENTLKLHGFDNIVSLQEKYLKIIDKINIVIGRLK